jgi:PAS domain S-box-containing protein
VVPVSAGDILEELARACATATTVEDQLGAALPLLLELTGARTALVERNAGDEVVQVARAGADAVASGVRAAAPDGRLADVSVPASWSEVGIVRAAAGQLPGSAGLLVLGWAEPASAGMNWARPALSLIGSGIARVTAEERLADLRARVDNAQQLANMGDYDWHIATDTNRWSDQLYRIYGHEPQSFNASYERFLAHIHPDDRERITAIHQHSYATGEPYQMIERIVRPDGQTRYLSSNGQVVRNADDAPERMLGTCVDITDRVLAEQDRERSAARFRGIVETCPEAILVVDGTGAIVQANGRASALLGADPVGRTLAEVLPAAAGTGVGVSATGLDGRALVVDVIVAGLVDTEDEDLRAVFLTDAAPRLANEALAATLREAEVRRRQALEINDNIVQGLTAAVLSLAAGAPDTETILERTLLSARRMMSDWLNPLGREDVHAGDLVRASASSLGDPPLPAPAPDRDAATHRARILVVDDHEQVRKLLREQVQSIGEYDVVGEAGDGEEAVQRASELQPDLVLLDLAMPRMDGLQALPLIRAAVPGVRVIVLSGFAQEMMEETALAAGAACYVEKGLRMDLAAVIEDVLSAA